MPRKVVKTKEIVVVKAARSPASSGRKRKARRARKRRGRGGGPMIGYSALLFKPFSCPSVKIPDDKGDASGALASRHTGTFSGTTAGEQAAHTYLITMSPFAQTLNMSVWIWDETQSPQNWVLVMSMKYANRTSIVGGPNWQTCMVREVASGMRLICANAEMFIGGRCHVVQHRVIPSASDDPTLFGPLGGGTYATTPGDILNAAVIRHTARVTDGAIEVHKIPADFNMTTTSGIVIPTNTVASNAIGSSGLNQTYSVLLEGIPVNGMGTSQVGATFEVDCITHWEVIPQGQYYVTYPLTPTCANPVEFAAARNLITAAKQARTTNADFGGGTITGGGGSSSGGSWSDSLSGFFGRTASAALNSPITDRLMQAAILQGQRAIARRMMGGGGRNRAIRGGSDWNMV